MAMSRHDHLIIFPNQLFDNHPGVSAQTGQIWLIEEGLFFGDHHQSALFHQQKLWFHRATMKRYEGLLRAQSKQVTYVEHEQGSDVLEETVAQIAQSKGRSIAVAEPHDYLLERRVRRYCDRHDLDLEILDSPMFLNTCVENQSYRAGRKRWFMADFYKHQRRTLGILVDQDGEPVGGQWSFDAENRKKVPKKLLSEIPSQPKVSHDAIDFEAQSHVRTNYDANPGNLETLFYPTSHESAASWLVDFFEMRFERFGAYEDAMVQGENWLWHSVLTPMLNVGLLTPRQVVDQALAYAQEYDVPLNSLEGFLRQIIGWREFMRATYVDHGVAMRTSNHWSHHRPMPASFYNGTTGIDPVDDVITRVLDTGYCHHIERLMILGGFMFLCEIDPNDIYTWFMELFVDSYDWVMVPNVYAMSQHADGGVITTKPYFSGSSYVKKMSNYASGDWTALWDGLYWRWIWNHVDDLGKNPRWAMMCSMARKMDAQKRADHLRHAESFLSQL